MSDISALWNIIKKWAKTGKLNHTDLARGSILLVDIVSKDNKRDNKGKLKRKSFSKKTQQITLIKQHYKCNICGKKIDEYNFDHIDGNRSNSSITNCQALCLNCHAKKTRKKNTKSF